MPRYHFNVLNGTAHLDEEGVEFADLATAKVAAVASAGAMIKDHAVRFWEEDDEWAMNVTDAKGLTLFRLTFNATLAPVSYIHPKP